MQDEPWGMYSALSTPTVVTTADQHILYRNEAAQRFWGEPAGDHTDATVWTVLRLAPVDGTDLSTWLTKTVMPALTTGDPVVCQTMAGVARPQRVRLSGTRVLHDGQWCMVLMVNADQAARRMGRTPDWALRDPLTGLHNRHEWMKQYETWDAAGGAVLIFDVDGLREINDLHGHRTGDLVLSLAAKALTEAFPDDALVVRTDGDEFSVLISPRLLEQAERMAARVVARTGYLARESGLTATFHLHHGARAFSPGHLAEALASATDAVSESKGRLIRATRGGHLLLTRDGQRRMRRTSDPATRDDAPGRFAHTFGPQFDEYVRQASARAVGQAQEFVEFVAPETGCIAVEVGAGSGRVAFDGGFAERIGPDGLLLVTDPSLAQIEAARMRARDAGYHWVYFIQAPAEELPIESETVDLIMGAFFLQFTEPRKALQSIVRTLRPGGRVALNQGLDVIWDGAWMEALEPVREAVAQHKVPLHQIFLTREGLEQLLTEVGLITDRVTVSEPERLVFPSADIAIGITRQNQMIRCLLGDVPSVHHGPVVAAFEKKFRSAYDRYGADGSAFSVPAVTVVAHRPT